MEARIAAWPRLHVEHLRPADGSVERLPVVMLHGAFHTGVSYLRTPDGRAGWARHFADRGHAVHVPDWPGHGRSGAPAGLAQLTSEDVAQAIARVIEAVGPAILLAHSAAGPVVWSIAERLPRQVAAIIGIAPGAPANLLRALPDDAAAVGALEHDRDAGCPVYSPRDRAVAADRSFVERFWAGSPRFPRQALEAYAATIVAESPVVLNERFNIGGKGLRLQRPEVAAARPILIVTGEHDPRHPRATDEALARYLSADFVWLPDIGIRGNGHMPMLEDNSDEIAGVLLRWLDSRNL